MDKPNVPLPNFNLWTEPWLTVETIENELLDLNLADVLIRAHTLRTVFDISPLVVMSVHRLLVAILQDIYKPQHTRDLVQIWQVEKFDPTRIEAFGDQYRDRFDLFSATAPFMQSADISLTADRDAKTVGYLFPDLPAGTAVTHYNHLYDAEQILCATCAAKGLVTTPAFASSGGAGIKPSINGVPPIYLLPGGNNYYQSLTASMATPKYQPTLAATANDQVWWQREPLVEKKGIVDNVGYLHSLTFTARRMRLCPVPMDAPCTRCGQQSAWGVRSMVYEMGESRPDDAVPWFDPFAAYVFPSAKADAKAAPRPLRPKQGQAYWREFSTLFLPQSSEGEANTLRPRLLEQLQELEDQDDVLPYGEAPIPFRLIGVRTDGKMKYFEWQEEGFLIPPHILHSPRADFAIRRALDLAESVAGQLAYVFRQHFGGTRDRERFRRLNADMISSYWKALASPFRTFVLNLDTEAAQNQAADEWITLVVHHAQAVFRAAAEDTGTDGASLRRQVEAMNHCDAAIRNTVKSKREEEKVS